MPGVVGVILAAGRATRFGSPKVLATLDGRPLLQHVVDRLGAATALARTPRPEALLIALGDQPRIDPAVIGALLATDPSHAVAVPRYPTGADRQGAGEAALRGGVQDSGRRRGPRHRVLRRCGVGTQDHDQLVDPGRAEAMGRAARARVADVFDIHAHARAVEGVFDELLASRAGAGA